MTSTRHMYSPCHPAGISTLPAIQGLGACNIRHTFMWIHLRSAAMLYCNNITAASTALSVSNIVDTDHGRLKYGWVTGWHRQC
jgi:hypothetical protein